MMPEGTGERRISKMSHYHTVEAGSEVTAGAVAGKESTAPKLAHFNTTESRRFADAQAVEQDLAYAVESLSALLDDGQIPGGSLIARSLLVAALVVYARCFNKGVRSHYSLDVRRIEAMDEGGAAYHRWLLDVRNKYIAHSVNAYEQAVAGLALSPPESGVRKVLGCYLLRGELVGLARPDVEQAIRFVSRSTFSLPSPSFSEALKSGKPESWLAFSSGARMCLLMSSPMLPVPFRATMSRKLAPGGMVMGAYRTPAYLSLTYLMNSRTRT